MPDSRHVVLGLTSMGTSESHLWMADLQRDRAWSLTRGSGSESYPSSSPDGRQVAFSAGNPTTMSSKCPAMAVRRLFGGDEKRVGSGVVGGSEPAGVCHRPRRARRDLGQQCRRPHALTVRWSHRSFFGDDRTIMLASPVFSPDGRRIAYQRNAQKPVWPLRIWISQTAGGPPVPLLPPTVEGYQSAPTWSPDGQWIAYADWTDRRVAAGQGARRRRATDHPAQRRRRECDAGVVAHRRLDHVGNRPDGFLLVSPDGTGQRLLSDEHWLAHTWSHDGTRIFGIRETEDLRLSLVSLDAASGRVHIVADLGPSPPVNNPVKGLSVSADGRSFRDLDGETCAAISGRSGT